MSMRTYAALSGTALLLVAAPSVQAVKPAAFRMADTKLSGQIFKPADKLRVTGKVVNASGRRAARPRVTISLRKSRSAKGGRRLVSALLRRTSAGTSRRFRARLVIPRSATAGTRYVFACVRPGRRSGRASCSRHRISVVRAPFTAPAPVPTPAPGPGGAGASGGDTRSAAQKLREAVNVAGMKGHLVALQQIADDNGGNRASGLPGYDVSAQYIRNQLRAAGYTPVTQVFDFVQFTENSDPIFQRTAPAPPRTYQPPTEDDTPPAEFQTMSYSDSGNVTATLQNVTLSETGDEDATSGCEPADFTGFTSGNVALMQRGTCPFAQKVANAESAGATAAVIFNTDGTTDVVAGTLGETAQDDQPSPPDIGIPAIGTSNPIGEQLATYNSTATVRVVTDVTSTPTTSSNVLADTPGGNPDNTVLIGSHLDSVVEGPGINDNGSGSAFNLETAIQMAKLGIQPANRVRFAFWGAEESGLVGATRYVAAITDEEFNQIAANLNFDMMASPNFARFIYDGDFSDSPPPATAPDVNPGAARIEQDFENYFDSQGLATEPTGFDGRSDYKPFQDNGIPAGGLFTGAEGIKTADQAVKFGGTAGTAFDPNYHQAGDMFDNINDVGYEQMSDAAAHLTGLYLADPALRDTLDAGATTPRRTSRSRSSGSRTVVSERLGTRFQR